MGPHHVPPNTTTNFVQRANSVGRAGSVGQTGGFTGRHSHRCHRRTHKHQAPVAVLVIAGGLTFFYATTKEPILGSPVLLIAGIGPSWLEEVSGWGSGLWENPEWIAPTCRKCRIATTLPRSLNSHTGHKASTHKVLSYPMVYLGIV